jgi:hypothetical protein
MIRYVQWICPVLSPPPLGELVLCAMRECFGKRYMLLSRLETSIEMFEYQWEDGDGETYDPDDVISWQPILPPGKKVYLNTSTDYHDV